MMRSGLQVLIDTFTILACLGMATLMFTTVVLWVFGLIDPAFLHPPRCHRTHDMRRPVDIAPADLIPPQSVPVPVIPRSED